MSWNLVKSIKKYLRNEGILSAILFITLLSLE